MSATVEQLARRAALAAGTGVAAALLLGALAISARDAAAEDVIGDPVAEMSAGPLFKIKMARGGKIAFAEDGGLMVTAGGDRGETLVSYDPDGKERWRFGRGDFPYPPAPLSDGGCVLVYFSVTREWTAARLDSNGKLIANFKGLETMSAPAVGPDGTAYLVRAGELLALSREMSTRWAVPIGDRSDLRDPPHVNRSNVVFAPGSRYLYGVATVGSVIFRKPLLKGPVEMSSDPLVGTLVVTRNPGPAGVARGRAELLDERGKLRARSKLRHIASAEIIPSLGMVVVGSMKPTENPYAVVYEAGTRRPELWRSTTAIGPGKVFDAAAGGLDSVYLSIDQGGPHVIAMAAREGTVRWKVEAPRPHVFVRGLSRVFAAPLTALTTLSLVTPDEVHDPSVTVDGLTPTEALPGPKSRIALRSGEDVWVYEP